MNHYPTCICPICLVAPGVGTTYISIDAYLNAHREAEAEAYEQQALELGIKSSMRRHPSYRSGVATFDDGSQVWIDGDMVAVRASRWDTWGPSVELEADG